MGKILVAKLSALAALMTTAVILSGCNTTAGKPELCKPDANVRCAKTKPAKATPVNTFLGHDRSQSRSDY